MRLGILTALWRRPELTEIMLRHTASLRVSGADIVRVAVRSPEDPELAPTSPDWHYVWASNDILSEKWTRGIQALRDMAVDAVLILGSDDFINETFLDRVVGLLQAKGSDYLQPGGLWLYDIPTGRCMYGEAGRVGAGRVLSASLLDLLAWQPWDEAKPGRLDQAMDNRLDPIVWPYVLKQMPSRGEVLLDIKTRPERADDQVWTYDDLAGLELAKYEGETFLQYHFPNVSDDILQLTRGVTHAPVN